MSLSDVTYLHVDLLTTQPNRVVIGTLIGLHSFICHFLKSPACFIPSLSESFGFTEVYKSVLFTSRNRLCMTWDWHKALLRNQNKSKLKSMTTSICRYTHKPYLTFANGAWLRVERFCLILLSAEKQKRLKGQWYNLFIELYTPTPLMKPISFFNAVGSAWRTNRKKHACYVGMVSSHLGINWIPTNGNYFQ